MLVPVRALGSLIRMFGRYAVCSRLGLTIYRRISFACSLIFCLVLLLFPCLNYGQSFGPLKEKITLHRKLPAVVHLSETTFTVKATSSASQQDVAQLLPVMLETELLKNEKSLRVDNTSPAITISCAITNFQTAPLRPSLATRQYLRRRSRFRSRRIITRLRANSTRSIQYRTKPAKPSIRIPLQPNIQENSSKVRIRQPTRRSAFWGNVFHQIYPIPSAIATKQKNPLCLLQRTS